MLRERVIGAFTFRQDVYADVQDDSTFTGKAWLLVTLSFFILQLVRFFPLVPSLFEPENFQKFTDNFAKTLGVETLSGFQEFVVMVDVISGWLIGAALSTLFGLIAFALVAFLVSVLGKVLFKARTSFDGSIRVFGLASVWLVGIWVEMLLFAVAPEMPQILKLITASLLGLPLLAAGIFAIRQSLNLNWVQTGIIAAVVIIALGVLIIFFLPLTPCTASITEKVITNPRVRNAILASTLRQSTPLILGALCGLLGERSGIINIGIEGQMLLAAFIGFLANVYTGNLLFAVTAGVLTGAVLGLFLAFMSVTLKMDQIIGGTVINILALGLTSYFYQTGLTTEGKLQPFALGPLANIPVIGPMFFNNAPITYATLILIFVVHYVLFYTRWGLRTRAVGEHPRAADTVGINVYLMRYANVILGGGIAGLAGAYLTLEAVGSFERAMTNGRGFVALAVMIFGKWTPLGSWGAALLFGFTSAYQTQIQFEGQCIIPHQFIGMLPYLLTIIVLAGFVGRSRPPAAVGQPYESE